MIEQIQFILIYCMTAVIWLVQLVQYPSFRYVAAHKFTEFHMHHSNRITPIVGPLMMGDLGCAFWLAYMNQSSLFYLLNLGGIVAIFLSTFLISVPLHNRLTGGYDRQVIERLISTNWIRTGLYSIRCIVWGYLFFWPSISH